MLQLKDPVMSLFPASQIPKKRHSTSRIQTASVSCDPFLQVFAQFLISVIQADFTTKKKVGDELDFI